MINVCFHGVGEPARELEPGEDRYWVTVDTFRSVLDEIATWPAVRISFDDGNASDVEHGLPALRERGLPATFFVLARRLGLPGSLTGDDLRSLRDAGMTIGSHGMDHRPWRGLPPEARER
ncbi:MAG: polysaccharide deacetylase family protein, partial [Kineosporiaceae bacterium]